MGARIRGGSPARDPLRGGRVRRPGRGPPALRGGAGCNADPRGRRRFRLSRSNCGTGARGRGVDGAAPVRTAERVEWELHAVPAASTTVTALPQLAPAYGLAASVAVEERCPVRALPSSL